MNFKFTVLISDLSQYLWQAANLAKTIMIGFYLTFPSEKQDSLA
jgi:hypothetical protein